MRIRHLLVPAVAAALVCGALISKPILEVQAGCANNPFRSGTIRVTPGVARSVTTLPPGKRLVITSVTSSPFDSTTVPFLEVVAGSSRVGIVPGKGENQGWHLETHFPSVDSQGGFNVPGGEELSLRLVADAPPQAPSVAITITGLVYECNLDTTSSTTLMLDQDVLTPLAVTPANRALVVRAAVSAAFELAPGATLLPSLEVYADGRLVGVVPGQFDGRSWRFETMFPFVTGIVAGPQQSIDATLRNGTGATGPVPVSFVTMSVFSP